MNNLAFTTKLYTIIWFSWMRSCTSSPNKPEIPMRKTREKILSMIKRGSKTAQAKENQGHLYTFVIYEIMATRWRVIFLDFVQN